MTFQEWCKEILPIVQAAANGEEIEYLSHTGKWVDRGDSMAETFKPRLKYRIKPRTIKVNGFDVPKPESEAPLYRSKYFIPVTNSYEFCKVGTWSGCEYDSLLFARGLIHLSDDNAIAHAKAMLGINPYKE